MKLILFLFFISVVSCTTKTYVWKGENVTEKKFKRELKRHTDSFVRANPEMIELFEDIEIKYDTTTIK